MHFALYKCAILCVSVWAGVQLTCWFLNAFFWWISLAEELTMVNIFTSQRQKYKTWKSSTDRVGSFSWLTIFYLFLNNYPQCVFFNFLDRRYSASRYVGMTHPEAHIVSSRCICVSTFRVCFMCLFLLVFFPHQSNFPEQLSLSLMLLA